MSKFKSCIYQFYEAFLKEFRMIKSDVGLLVFFILLPLAYPIVYSLIYNPELVRDVALVVVDDDRSSTSRELVRRIDATQGANVIGYAADLPEARRAVDSHKAYGILQIPEGFGRKVGRGEQANAVMYCEMSLLLRYRALLVSSTDVMQDYGAEITQQRIDEIAPLAETLTTGNGLMPIENVYLGNIEGGFDSFIMPGILILILQQALMLAVGMAGGAMRENPDNSDFDPRTGRPRIWLTMPARIIAYLIIMILPTIYVIHYVPLMFKFPMAGNVFEELAFILPMLLATIGMGFVLQGIVRERESVFCIWVVTSVIFLFLSGLTWPRYAITGVWRVLADCVPATWGVEGFVRMNSNGASLAQVHSCYINLWIQAAAYLFLGFLTQKYIQRPAIMRAWKSLHNQAAAEVAEDAKDAAEGVKPQAQLSPSQDIADADNTF